MLTELRRLDATFAPALAELALRANDVRYPLETLIDEKCFGIGAEAGPVVIGAFSMDTLCGAAVSCGRYLRLLMVDRSWRRHGIGSALLERVTAEAAANALPHLILGAEPGNYFVPGVDAEAHEARAFFERRHFISGDVATNLVASLEHDWKGALRSVEGIAVRRAGRQDANSALDFIGAQFGALWRFEVSHAFNDPREAPLFLAWRDDEVVGFSAHEVNNRGAGFYGPAGVVKELRGYGVGRELLLASLDDLRTRGHRKVLIPWVSSIEFYRKVAHAEVDATFITMEKRLK